MPPASDPYRTLGLNPAATPAEIKRAYRRLAKAYHPDSAGERDLPRFLAIQAAYERLMSGQPGTRPVGSDGSSRRGAGPSPAAPPAGRPWSADAERARATRDAFRKRTTRSSARSGPGATGPAGSADSGAGTKPGRSNGSTSGMAGGTDSGSAAGARPGRGSRRGRPKATIGSTSYDGTEGEPFEPGWSGAGWYGAASGTYWTINPKEYADPRKHGPEYLARARRGAKAESEAEAGAREATATSATASAAETDTRAGASDPAPGPGEPPSAPPTGDGYSAGSTRAGPGKSAERSGPPPTAARGQPPTAARGQLPPPRGAAPRHGSPQTRSVYPPSSAPGPTAPIQPARFAALDPIRLVRSWRGRLLLAALAWFPIGLAIFGIHGQLTGCSRFLAGCTDPVAWSVWIPQLIAVALLACSPRLAWIAASGSIVLVGLTLPLAAILTVASGGRPASAGTAELLDAVMAVGWLAGVGIAASGRIPLPPWRVARVR
jgi:curved DNA-binding protein CbpA